MKFSAFPADAIAAVEKFQGKEFAGRKLILEIAVFKGQTTKAPTANNSSSNNSSSSKRDIQQVQKEENNEQKIAGDRDGDDNEEETKQNKGTADSNLPSPSLQIIVCGVPSNINKKVFKEKILKAHNCKKIVVELIQEVRNNNNIIFYNF